MAQQESHTMLLNQGKIHKEEGRLDEAIESFARAVELKMAEVDSEISACLANYLVEYADALLVKEEASSTDFLRAFGNPQQSTESDDDEGTTSRLDSGRLDQARNDPEVGEEDLSDLQLAWESFEHARLCIQQSDDSTEKFEQLSFVHCRLGDIQALQEQFASSIADYGESIDYATKGNASARKLAGLIVSLCQTVQVFITTDEFQQLDDSFVQEIVSRFQKVFSDVASKYIPSHQITQATDCNPMVILTRDGFLLAHALLSTVESTDVKSTMDELIACAKDCLDGLPKKQISPGITSSGFPAPTNPNIGEAVVVAVKRKLRDSVDGSSEPPAKESKADETDGQTSDELITRADKAKLVD
jgi:tetratricopeptide (TPR) repeat protein